MGKNDFEMNKTTVIRAVGGVITFFATALLNVFNPFLGMLNVTFVSSTRCEQMANCMQVDFLFGSLLMLGMFLLDYWPVILGQLVYWKYIKYLVK